ncbi:MAG TPA: hypothetical protein VG248_04145 [Caulobacteraceae bacterium]|jgi:hypothetical protein|nr:hypothetical protein [Caulobacteraceae bacterium]
MSSKTALLGGATACVFALTATAAAQAATAHKHHAATKVVVVEKVNEAPAMRAELEALRQEVEQLQANQAQSQAQAQAQVEAMRAQVAQAQAQAQAAQAQFAEQIQTIPGTVKREVAAVAPKTDKIYYKGVTVQFGGFAAMESVWRAHNEGADVGSSYSGIPGPYLSQYHTGEYRMTARQSRLSLLAEANVSPAIHLTGYGEFDFMGSAVTANSNESNSYQPRIRNLFAAIDWDQPWGGFEFFGGQNWSLATMTSKGIVPRSEAPPPTIEAQYVPGFVWARQPQMRLTANINKQLWFAVSVENPQTTFYTSGKYNSGVALFNTVPGGSEFPSQAGIGYTLSENKQPDVIAKVAVDQKLAGHNLHAEAFGIYRDFYVRENTGAALANVSATGGGFGGGLMLGVIPSLLDVQVSGLAGRGIGRYGSSQLPDVGFGPDGRLKPVSEWDLLAGGTVHIGKSLDFYVFGGEERDTKQPYTVSNSIYNGVGNPLLNNAGCEIEGSTCGNSTHYVDQITAGFWDRPYVGKFGKIQWGIQYSYTERHLFPGYGTVTPGAQTFNAAPTFRENMVFTSVRYYPF